MKGRDPRLRAAYLLLFSGAAGLAAFFFLYSGIPGQMARPAGSLLFALWILAPFILMTLNTWIVSRYIHPGQGGRLFLYGTLSFLAAGLLIYSRAVALSRVGAMEPNLVFIFGPFYHFGALLGITVVYLGRSVWLLFPRSGAPRPQG